MNIKESEPLSNHTSFRTGGPARFFVDVETVDELRDIIRRSQNEKIPYLVLGEGTNVLFSDNAFEGYVIRPKIKGVTFQDELLIASAGENWDGVVACAVSKDLSGIENLSHIPGSVGAAPVQNIGAYGVEIKDVIEWVEVYNPDKDKIETLSRERCQFGYRDSFFKSPVGKKYIIVRVAMRLKKNGQSNISYKDLQKYFSGRQTVPTLNEVRSAVIDIRRQKMPDITKVGTAGSFFKNPIIETVVYKKLLKQFPDLPAFPAKDGFKKIPLAWIIDKVLGFKGLREGNVGVYENQSLVLVNYSDASGYEVKKFSKKISDAVKNKTGIEIEYEVNFLGNF